MSEWKDISTVPRNQKVLVYMPNYRVSNNNVHFATYHENISVIADCFEFDFKPEELPTHWMELPNPPEKK